MKDINIILHGGIDMLSWLLYLKKVIENAMVNENDENAKKEYLEEIKRIQKLINDIKYTR